MKASLRDSAKLLPSLEIWVVTGAVALSMVKPTLLPWAVLLALLFWPIRWMTHGKLSRRTPADIGILLLLLMVPVTLWATPLPEKTVLQVYRLTLGILYFFTILNWASNRWRMFLIISGIILVGFGLAVMALFSVQFATTKIQFIPQGIYQAFEQLVKDTIHPNVMAGSIAIIIPIGLSILIFAWRNLKNWKLIIALITTLLPLIVLILTQSRGALIGLGTSLLILVILRWRWGWAVIPLVIIGISILIGQIGINYLLDFISSGVSVNGVEGRIDIWSRAIFMIQDFSFTGVGMGLYGDVADLLYPLFLSPPGKIPHAHNLYLQIAVDLGIPGLIFWLATLIIIINVSWQTYNYGRLHGDTLAMGLGAGFLGSQLTLCVHGISDSVTWGMIRPSPIVWAIWGAGIAAWNVIVIKPQLQGYMTNPKSQATDGFLVNILKK
jgi:putative inorganic carbon (HCO3(-)) transporter